MSQESIFPFAVFLLFRWWRRLELRRLLSCQRHSGGHDLQLQPSDILCDTLGWCLFVYVGYIDRNIDVHREFNKLKLPVKNIRNDNTLQKPVVEQCVFTVLYICVYPVLNTGFVQRGNN